jgi:hypothetical protein
VLAILALKKLGLSSASKWFGLSILIWSALVIAGWQYAAFLDVYASDPVYAPMAAPTAAEPFETAISWSVCATITFLSLWLFLRPRLVANALPLPPKGRWITALIIVAFSAGCSLWLIPILGPDGSHFRPAIPEYDALQTTYAISNALPTFAPVAAILVFVALAGVTDVPNWSGRPWTLALVLSSVVANTEFFYGLPLEWLGCFLVLLAVGTQSAANLRGLEDVRRSGKSREALFDSALLGNEMRRAEAALRKAQSDFVAGSLTPDDYPARVHDLEAFMRYSKRNLPSTADLDGGALAFGTGPYRSDLGNGRVGAVAGAALGIVVAVAMAPQMGDMGHVPLLGIGSYWLSNILGNAVMGFGFGFYFPYLRGGTGSTKALILTLIGGLGSLPYLLLSQPRIGAIDEILGLAANLGAIGLVFDHLAIRATGKSWSLKQLLEIVGLGNLGAASAVIVTILTTIATNELREVVEAGVKSALPVIASGASPH